MNDILQVSGAHQILNFGVKLVHSTKCEHENLIVWLVENSCVITSLNDQAFDFNKIGKNNPTGLI